jgi:selenocysteine lyase/cysteine desulfurase
MNSEIRKLFPATQNYVYLNSASVAPLPVTAVEAVRRQLLDVSENGAEHYAEWIDTKKRARQLIADNLGVGPAEIAFMRNTSDALAAVANGYFAARPEITEGANIVSFAGEFPANYYPWRAIRDRLGVELRLCRESDGRVDPDELISLIDTRTAIVAISAVQFDSGFQSDLSLISAELKKRAGDASLLVVDVIQAFGARAFDIPRLGVDAVAGASHKWLCAPEGCGFLYVSKAARELIEPVYTGWMSVTEPWDFLDREQPLKPNALAWETGTGCSALFYGLEASLKLLTDVGMDNIAAYLERLSDQLCEMLAGTNYEIISSRRAGEKSQIVCIRHRGGRDANSIAAELAERKIIVSARNGRLRIAPHFFNDESDLDRLLAALPK